MLVYSSSQEAPIRAVLSYKDTDVPKLSPLRASCAYIFVLVSSSMFCKNRGGGGGGGDGGGGDGGDGGGDGCEGGGDGAIQVLLIVWHELTGPSIPSSTHVNFM